jgi:hypothetical protein
VSRQRNKPNHDRSGEKRRLMCSECTDLIIYAYEGVLRLSLRHGRQRTVERVKARMAARYKADPNTFARWAQYAEV